MKLLLLALAGFFALHFGAIQNEEFVCLPCGRACDNEVFRARGTCPSCNMNLVEKTSIHFSNVSPQELCNRILSNPKVVLLDVRSAGEFSGAGGDVPTFGRFKNALNINVSDLESRVGELKKYKDSEILVYCSHAHRSAVASYFLTTHGFKNVRNMSGGVSTIDHSNDCLNKSFVFHSQ